MNTTITPQSKTCIKCHEPKSILSFSPSKQRRDGRYPYCKPCEAKRKAKFRVNNPEVNINAVHKVKYGHTYVQRLQILSEQDNKCARCATALVEGRTCADHNHFCCDGPYTCGSCFNAYICAKCNSLLTKKWILAHPSDPYVMKHALAVAA
jgi:hypothetical protein